ncbi:MAG: hypothetical protein NTV21_19315 [Planctomycetota bacterium]|nr:hypothetical protein [Planctomycetota bacterium]
MSSSFFSFDTSSTTASTTSGVATHVSFDASMPRSSSIAYGRRRSSSALSAAITGTAPAG